MSLLDRIINRLEHEPVTVSENTTENAVGVLINNFNVNKRGVVLQFSIPAEETDEGVIEDFLETMEAAVQELNV